MPGVDYMGFLVVDRHCCSSIEYELGNCKVDWMKISTEFESISFLFVNLDFYEGMDQFWRYHPHIKHNNILNLYKPNIKITDNFVWKQRQRESDDDVTSNKKVSQKENDRLPCDEWIKYVFNRIHNLLDIFKQQIS